jgi:hypothetical protein
VVHKAKEDVNVTMRQEKKLNRQFEIMDTLVRQDVDEVKRQVKAEKARREAEEKERK